MIVSQPAKTEEKIRNARTCAARGLNFFFYVPLRPVGKQAVFATSQSWDKSQMEKNRRD
jgi:hypothetical protein